MNRAARVNRRLIFIELNEINFDIVRSYLATTPLPAFQRLFSGPWIRTTAEERYEDLEPWIQWPSAHTGLSASEHNVFRLGDIVHNKAPQIFERLESWGFRVGCISAMNAENRLKDPAYFIPDPWTDTPPDKSWWSRALAQAVSQAVNDNSSQRLTAKSAFYLLLGFMRFAQPKNYSRYLRLAVRSRDAPWRKALVLDLFLHDLHMRMFHARRPHYSTLFLNGGAHIQHHYFLNARPVRTESTLANPDWYVPGNVDPVAEMLSVYDRILADYLAIPGIDVIVATGLSQRPYDRAEYYYRLRDHGEFLKRIGIRCRAVQPRMTRDFLIEFDSAAEAKVAENRLAAISVDGTALFGEVDNRGDSLFVVLTYPKEITQDLTFEVDGKTERLALHVVFVAIKNGMHQTGGFAFFTPDVGDYAPSDGSHVKELYFTVERYFSA
ncbi:MAG: hypothetical protein ABI645_16295 [Pseudomonadota bacterium]